MHVLHLNCISLRVLKDSHELISEKVELTNEERQFLCRDEINVSYGCELGHTWCKVIARAAQLMRPMRTGSRTHKDEWAGELTQG